MGERGVGGVGLGGGGECHQLKGVQPYNDLFMSFWFAAPTGMIIFKLISISIMTLKNANELLNVKFVCIF